MKRFIGITGTTCVGKSDVAVELAKMLGSEVISADSMQIYRGMDIGTAKITHDQMQNVKHHMLDIAEPNEDFSSFVYRESAAKLIESAERTPIVVGGTGFYFDALLYPPEFGTVSVERRNQLNQILDEKGLDALVEMLRKLDAKTAETIDLCNPKRIVRAIEIAESGVKKSDGSGKNRQPCFDCKLFVLQTDRAKLYEKIDERVDKMFENGLIEEVKNLVDKFGLCDTSAFNAIGYKEVIEYLNGEITLEDAVRKVKLNTRHYAKRQITYFKRMDVSRFVDVDGKSPRQTAEYIRDCLIDWLN